MLTLQTQDYSLKEEQLILVSALLWRSDSPQQVVMQREMGNTTLGFVELLNLDILYRNSQHLLSRDVLTTDI